MLRGKKQHEFTKNVATCNPSIPNSLVVNKLLAGMQKGSMALLFRRSILMSIRA